jgi:protein gp37
MADNTKIEWTDATWNPITGCSVVSPGCTNCYAMRLAGTRLAHHESRAGLTRDTKAGPVWTGEVRFNEQWLDQPLRWKKPRLIFVCAHGDLFAEGVPDAWIDRVFAVMALAPQHTFQVLTKRSARMRAYMGEADGLGLQSFGVKERVAVEAGRMMEDGDNAHDATINGPWPLPNVWLGVSVEDQKRADERIPDLLATPAAIRWISAEPLLGPVSVLPYCFIYTHADEAVLSEPEVDGEPLPMLPWRDPTTTPRSDIATPRLDWVVVGGESGPGARPMHPDWARSLRDECAAADVAFHFKQWGEYREVWTPVPELIDNETDRADELYSGAVNPSFVMQNGKHILSRDDLPWDEGDPARLIERIGKSRAGRLLDGIEHNGWPQVQP